MRGGEMVLGQHYMYITTPSSSMRGVVSLVGPTLRQSTCILTN